jgi:hypothetical protein
MPWADNGVAFRMPREARASRSVLTVDLLNFIFFVGFMMHQRNTPQAPLVAEIVTFIADRTW